MESYAAARLEEIEQLNDGRCPYRPVRHHLGITAFGVTAWSAAETGDRIINEHDEAEPDLNEELYLVTDGRARFEIDGADLDAPAGTLVFVRPGALRTAFAREPGTTIVAVGAPAGRPYEPTGWELWAPAARLYETGDYAGAAERGQALLQAYPDHAGMLYNVACCESLAGHTAEAIGHLRQAIAGSERFRELAREDSDLDPLRHDPDFQRLLDTR